MKSALKFSPHDKNAIDNTTEKLIKRDLRYVWHPGYQLKTENSFRPLVIKEAQGSYLHLENGEKVIDVISSWWCKTLGHQHPRLKKALYRQAETFEHVMLANTSNETIVDLSEKLASLCPDLTKVFYASEGSTAIEIAIKMSLHSRVACGDYKRTGFIALKQGYHGESIAALSVGDLGLYCKPYSPLLFESQLIDHIPYVNSTDDPLWHDCSAIWANIEKQLEPFKETTTAIILEPIVQSVAGMKMYSQDFLRRLRQWSKQHNIHLIADEIMTGIGRTGEMLACNHADITPDFICLGKNLTSGWLALSVVLTSEAIYDCFYDEYTPEKTFAHSNTFSGNALAASIANELLSIFTEIDMCTQTKQLGKLMLSGMHDIANNTGMLENVRGIGAIVAADVIEGKNNSKLMHRIYQEAVERGLLLRPTANTIYWLPPLNTKTHTIAEIIERTEQTLTAVREK